jgi:hypothetical protein
MHTFLIENDLETHGPVQVCTSSVAMAQSGSAMAQLTPAYPLLDGLSQADP